MKSIISFLCCIGLHSTEKITYKFTSVPSGKIESAYYMVCKHCGDGDPMITDEW